jgi:hypothetical protein
LSGECKDKLSKSDGDRMHLIKRLDKLRRVIKKGLRKKSIAQRRRLPLALYLISKVSHLKAPMKLL